MDDKILIVDDALFMRTTLKRVLSQAGYQNLHEACDGEEACRICEEICPRVVLMDISMPNMDGIAALKQIKKKWPGTEVIMCSAVGQEAMIVDALESGAAEFIVKPFKPDQIVQAVKAVLETGEGRE